MPWLTVSEDPYLPFREGTEEFLVSSRPGGRPHAQTDKEDVRLKGPFPDQSLHHCPLFSQLQPMWDISHSNADSRPAASKARYFYIG